MSLLDMPWLPYIAPLQNRKLHKFQNMYYTHIPTCMYAGSAIHVCKLAEVKQLLLLQWTIRRLQLQHTCMYVCTCTGVSQSVHKWSIVKHFSQCTTVIVFEYLYSSVTCTCTCTWHGYTHHYTHSFPCQMKTLNYLYVKSHGTSPDDGKNCRSATYVHVATCTTYRVIAFGFLPVNNITFGHLPVYFRHTKDMGTVVLSACTCNSTLHAMLACVCHPPWPVSANTETPLHDKLGLHTCKHYYCRKWLANMTP